MTSRSIWCRKLRITDENQNYQSLLIMQELLNNQRIFLFSSATTPLDAIPIFKQPSTSYSNICVFHRRQHQPIVSAINELVFVVFLMPIAFFV